MAERGRNKKRGPLSKEAKARQKQRRKEEIQQLKNIGVGALETFTPLGDVQTAKDASKAFQEGRYFDAAGNAALIAAGYTPLGPLVRPAGRLAKRVVRDKDMLLPALTDKDYAGLVARETIMGKGPLAGKSVGAAGRFTDEYYEAMREAQPGRHFFIHGTSGKYAKDLVDEGVEVKGPFHLSQYPMGSAKYAGNDGELVIISVPEGVYPPAKRGTVTKNTDPELQGMPEWILEPDAANEFLMRNDVKISRTPVNIAKDIASKRRDKKQ